MLLLLLSAVHLRLSQTLCLARRVPQSSPCAWRSPMQPSASCMAVSVFGPRIAPCRVTAERAGPGAGRVTYHRDDGMASLGGGDESPREADLARAHEKHMAAAAEKLV